MTIKAHPAHSQQRAFVDFESNRNRRVLGILSPDLNACFRVTQRIQAGANCEGDPLKRCWIGRSSDPGHEFPLLEYFFDLPAREQPGAGILHLGNERQLIQMKNQSHAFGVLRRWRR